ncbi:MAG: VPLPA-CTERM sorting domain-containing protein [Thiogranum sp.]
MSNLPVKLAAIAGISLIATQSQAAVCDAFAGVGETALEGTTVCFVYDPADVDPLFGSLSVSGDNIFATPTSFKAESNDGAGTVQVSATGTVQVIAKPGYVLDGINVGEIGDYRMVQAAGGNTSVDVEGWLRVFDWFDPTPIFGTEETTNLAIAGDLSIADGNNHNWSGSGSFDLTTALWDGRDYVGLTLQNTLTAFSTLPGDQAMIQKKAVGSEITVSIETSPVPVPAALWLFGSGLLGLVGIARRRS